MVKENRTSHWLCTFNLKNNQQSFAECLQSILWLEEISNNIYENTNTLSNHIFEFFISRANSSGINNKDYLLKHEEILKKGNTSRTKKIDSKEMLLSGLQKESDSNVFYYYFRIDMLDDESDITDLQYFVLILQSIPSIKDRVAVRLMKNELDGWNTGDFYRASHFLRFIQKKYNCFYACYNNDISSLRKLIHDQDTIQRTFLPLLEVDEFLCHSLSKSWFVDFDYQQQQFDKLYMAIFPRDCNSNSLTWTLFKIGFRMMFSNLNGRKYKSSKVKQELLEQICNLVNGMQGISPLDMLLLGTLIAENSKEELKISNVKNLLGKTQMLSLAIGQILENIVNHSERSLGVFTFRLQTNHLYLQSHYPDYKTNKKAGLEILISDSNQKDNIVKHFLNSNKADERIKALSGNINLSHLFGDYHNNSFIEDVWKQAKSKRPEMCHGLISFLSCVRNLKGAVRVRSSPNYLNNGFEDVYYFNGTQNDYETSEFLEGNYIPGTQFSIVINRELPTISQLKSRKNEDWAFDFNKLVYATTYKELAQSLLFDSNIKDLKISKELLENFCNQQKQEDKDKFATKWKEWFNNQISTEKSSQKLVYKCDLDLICGYIAKNQELGEPFCKGFLSSKFFVNNNPEAYYSVLFLNPTANFSRIFAGTLNALNTQSFFNTNNTCVYFYPKRFKDDNLPYCASTLHDLLDKPLNQKIFPRVFPYTLFLKTNTGETIFEQELLNQAQTSISDNENQGFKIKETHMRLGNKVHLDTFYEMALFFENPNYAYYTAFLFLKKFLNERIDLIKEKQKIIFYGYASYSRAIVWAIIRILEEYKKLLNINEFPEMAFVIYQNDLKLESDQPQTQMYYSKENWQRNHSEIWEPEETALVMIVPISSSLTTFNKMRSELNRATSKNFDDVENYTAFWVRNNYTDIRKPTSEEMDFWQEANPSTKTIKSGLVCGDIHYLVSVTSGWSNPLKCQHCFPSDPLLEYPLVETDPTSTVPTQQFYRYQNPEIPSAFSDTKQEKINDERVKRLKTNVIYGHVSKSGSHYQYYVKAREYFQQESSHVKLWLKNLRQQALDDHKLDEDTSNSINILVIPQQTNNVEFGQYVYEYYFEGCAECIIVNTEKEFRSNLKAEYSGLFRRLLEIDNPEKNIKFHYVDIAVNSGNSFSRMTSLISSCMEEINRKIKLNTPASSYKFSFDQVFLLISRLSNDSKYMYVQNPQQNFHSYVEINISAMRTFGDSCVPCKLQQESKRYYKKSATKSISAYWEQKSYDRLCIPFDKLENTIQDNVTLQEEGYKRMMCSHRLAHYIRPVQGAETPLYFDALRNFLEELRSADNNTIYKTCIYSEVRKENHREWISAALKVIARPFFSYDYKMRCIVMDIFLILSEHLIKGCNVNSIYQRIEQSDKKHYLLKGDNIQWIISFADSLMNAVGNNKHERIEFIRDNILKGLADIKSNYLLRKESIVSISKRLSEITDEHSQAKQKEFFDHYIRSILRLTHSSSDETKSVWLEFLLQFGCEYNSEIISDESNTGIDKIVNIVPLNIKENLRNFLEVLLVENNRPLYQAVTELCKRIKGDENNGFEITLESANKLLGEYHMRNAAQFISFRPNVSNDPNIQLCALSEFLIQLNDKSHDITCYRKLGDKIQKIVESEKPEHSSIILFGKKSDELPIITKYLKLPNYFTLFPENFDDETRRQKSQEKLYFEKQWQQLINNKKEMMSLEEKGFELLTANSDPNKFNIIIMLENNYEKLKNLSSIHITHQKIDPIYIYCPCELCKQQALSLTRMILMFRKKLIEWLENDFNNNAIAILSQQQHLAQILSTDKMGDHAENGFVECQQKLLMVTNKEEFVKELSEKNWEYSVTSEGKRANLYDVSLESKPPLLGMPEEARDWFFLRSYVNSRISRLFRTMARASNEYDKSKKIINADIYYARKNQSIMMRPAYDIQTIFFTPIKVGYIRKNYLKQIMKTVTFVVQGIADYETNENADIDERMKNLSGLLEGFDCISFHLDNNAQHYAYLSEYLATILLDCFVSGVKAGKIWNECKWGGEAFQKLNNSKACDKCKIYIDREHGYSFNGVSFDYLVISNTVHHPKRFEKKGLGMSQAAIRWYIEGIWLTQFGNSKECPEVISQETKDKYIIKLPILKSEGGYQTYE